MDNDSIFGHIVHCTIVLYSIVYIEILGTHFHNYCTKIILHNADSISAVVPRKASPTLNMLLVHKKFRAESIKSIFLLPGFYVLQMYHCYYFVLFKKILRNCTKGKVVPVLNYVSTAPLRRMGDWMYRPTFCWPRHQLEVSGQVHASADLPPGKEPPVCIE
jgi:hypothetical protein